MSTYTPAARKCLRIRTCTKWPRGLLPRTSFSPRTSTNRMSFAALKKSAGAFAALTKSIAKRLPLRSGPRTQAGFHYSFGASSRFHYVSQRGDASSLAARRGLCTCKLVHAEVACNEHLRKIPRGVPAANVMGIRSFAALTKSEAADVGLKTPALRLRQGRGRGGEVGAFVTLTVREGGWENSRNTRRTPRRRGRTR